MNVSEFVGVIAVTVTINVGFLAFLVARERGKGKKLKRAARDARDALAYMRAATTETVESLQALDIKVKDVQNQVYRVMAASTIGPETRSKIVTLLHSKDLRLEKTLQELSLFSHDPVVRFSACKMLAMNCGDATSLEKLTLVAEHEPESALRGQYRPYIDALKARLDGT